MSTLYLWANEINWLKLFPRALDAVSSGNSGEVTDGGRLTKAGINFQSRFGRKRTWFNLPVVILPVQLIRRITCRSSSRRIHVELCEFTSDELCSHCAAHKFPMSMTSLRKKKPKIIIERRSRTSRVTLARYSLGQFPNHSVRFYKMCIFREFLNYTQVYLKANKI